MTYPEFGLAQDWFPFMNRLFELKKFERVLEFGVGIGTRFFLDRCDKVKSIELALRGDHGQWSGKCVGEYWNRTNWELVFHPCGSDMAHANNLGEGGRYTDVLPNMLIELDSIFELHVRNETWDMIFVDSGFHPRAKIIQKCLPLTGVVVGHDTNVSPEVYGWDSIRHDGFEKLHFPQNYLGTTLWIRNDLVSLADEMKAYKHGG